MTGYQFEDFVCRRFFDNGWWALNIPRNNSGAQPFDVIAIKGDRIAAIDCKVCANDRFDCRRIEANQNTSFAVLKSRSKNVAAGFLCWYNDRLYFIPCELIPVGAKSIKLSERYADYADSLLKFGWWSE